MEFTPERWGAAIHCLDAIFYPERKSISVAFKQSAIASAVLDKIAVVVEGGYAERALQKSPHLVLLNHDWYHLKLKGVMAEWMHLWLNANHFASATKEMVLAYLTGDESALAKVDWEGRVYAHAIASLGASQSSATGARTAQSATTRDLLHAYMELTLDARSFKMANLSADWLKVYLPHVLAKIDRVSFGLLSGEEYTRMLKLEPTMPITRWKRAELEFSIPRPLLWLGLIC